MHSKEAKYVYFFSDYQSNVGESLVTRSIKFRVQPSVKEGKTRHNT